MNITLYGIPNCNTVKKTMTWLAEQKIPYTFHNYKKEGITKKMLNEWTKQVSWERLLNKQSATWRGIDKETQASISNAKNAIDVLASHSSMIKRPIITLGKDIKVIGFDEAALKALKDVL